MKQLRFTITVIGLSATLLLTNCGEDDGGDKPSIGFESSSSTAAEGTDVTVFFSVPLPSGTTPQFTLGGTALEGTDYTYAIISAGIVFSIIDDGLADMDEILTVTLTGFEGQASLGAVIVHTITIKDAIGFISSANTRVEGESIIVAFNQPLPVGTTLSYNVSGTAIVGEDYTITQSQSGFFVTTKKDEVYDHEETIIIELTEFSGGIPVDANGLFTLTIFDEDATEAGRIEISLSWNVEAGGPGDVDMDLLVWYQTSPGVFISKGNLWSTEGGSPVGTPFESTIIYDGVEPSGKWGFSYVYFGGTSDNLDVTVKFRSYKGNINQTSNQVSFIAAYTLANQNNDYDQLFDSGDILAQTFIKTGNDFTDLEPIFVAPAGSRNKSLIFILDDDAQRIIEKKMHHIRR